MREPSTGTRGNRTDGPKANHALTFDMDYSSRAAQLSDVIAPDQKTTVSVLGNFKQMVKKGDLRMHPIIAWLVDIESLERMGVKNA